VLARLVEPGRERKDVSDVFLDRRPPDRVVPGRLEGSCVELKRLGAGEGPASSAGGRQQVAERPLWLARRLPVPAQGGRQFVETVREQLLDDLGGEPVQRARRCALSRLL
jgi:hypothetical protein